MKKPGTAPDLLVRGWVPIEVQNLAVPSISHARGLRPCGSRDPPAAFDGSGCALVLSRKESGLIIATCGLGGPHYATIPLTIASSKLSLWANWLRDAGSYWSESLMVLSPEGWYTLCRGRRPR